LIVRRGRIITRNVANYIFLLDRLFVLHNNIFEKMNTPDQKAPGDSGLYNRIAVLRAERGISRMQLADAMGVNYQTIGFLERGDYSPSLKLALALGEYFGLPVEAIFSNRPLHPLSQQVYGRAAKRYTPGTESEEGEQ
jgi:DNA-binding XRE family transcriptional regulator